MERLLIIGLGDVARRALPLLRSHFEILALVRPQTPVDDAALAQVHAIRGDLDHPESLQALGGRAVCVLHTAPPPASGRDDPRTRNLLAALAAQNSAPERIVYISTSGVYGDCGGEFVAETRAPNPRSDRAFRRTDAESQLFDFGRRHGTRIVVLRAPGIYAQDRLPLRRLRNGTPVLCAADDVYTNHIHADDLATMCHTALIHPHAAGLYNACDDAALPMSTWFDLLADRAGLPRPPRIPRGEAPTKIPPPLLSFMSESRRLSNEKIKHELGVVLRYPTVYEGVPAKIDASVG